MYGLDLNFPRHRFGLCQWTKTSSPLCHLMFQISQSLCLHWWCAWLGWSLTDVDRKQKVLPKGPVSVPILTLGWVSSMMLFGADRTDWKSSRCTYLSVHRKWSFRCGLLGCPCKVPAGQSCFYRSFKVHSIDYLTNTSGLLWSAWLCTISCIKV